MHAMNPRTPRRQAGLSLIEMMVALVLGLILLGAVLQVYLSTKLTFVAQDQKSVVEESGRFAIDFLARDLRMAGLTGCGSRTVPGGQALPIRNHLNFAAAYPFQFTEGLRGFEANGTGPTATYTIAASNPAPGGSWNAPLPAVVAARAIPGSDVLLVSGSAPQTWPLVDPYTSGSQIFVQPGNDIVQGDLLFVTDCAQGFVFQATNVTQTGPSTNVTGSAGGPVAPGNNFVISAQGPNGAAFRQGAMVARANSLAYFVGQGAGGTPSLYRASLLPEAGAPSNRTLQVEEMIRGVESMQLLYGRDNNGDFAVDEYLPANAITDWTQIRTLQVAFLVRGEENSLATDDTTRYTLLGTTIDPVDDRRQRRVFATTISLRNRLP